MYSKMHESKKSKRLIIWDEGVLASVTVKLDYWCFCLSYWNMQSSQSDLERTAGQANSPSQGVQDHMMEQTHASISFFLKEKSKESFYFTGWDGFAGGDHMT